MKPENWIRWDLLSENDVKTQWYLSQFEDKARALGFFLHIVCKMYQSDDGKVENSQIFLEGTAAVLGWTVEEVEQAIAKLIQAKLFFACDCYITSSKVQRELEHRKNLSESRARAGSKGGLTRAQNVTNSDSSKQLLSKSKQIQANSSRSDQSRLEEIRSENKNISAANQLVARAREGTQPTLGGVDPLALVKKIAADKNIIPAGPEKLEIQEKPKEPDPPNQAPQQKPSSTKLSERFAYNILCQPSGHEPWEKENLYLVAGRRPMKKLPNVWLTEAEVVDTVEQYERNGLGIHEVRSAIKSAEGRLKTAIVNGRGANTVSVYNWLIGWCLQEQLDIANAANKARRSAK